MPKTTSSRNEYLWLAAILALALILRVVGLNQPLWYDEIVTIDNHLRLPWGALMQDYSMNYHYLFNLQSKAFMGLFGDMPWVIRLPAVVFGVGAIAAMWWLARDIAGRFAAHITALLLAISYHHIWFSQNARGYTELAFWATLGTVLFLRGLARPRPAIWVGYGVVLALAVFTHLTGAFMFVAHGVVWLGFLITNGLRHRLDRAQISLPMLGYVIGGVITLMLYAPVMPSLLAVVGAVSETSSIDVMQEYQNPVWTVLEGVRTAIGGAGPLVAVIALGVIGLALAGGFVTQRTSPMFGPIVITHIGLSLILLTTLGMRIWPRFFFIDIGFLMLLIVLGVRAVCTGLAKLPMLQKIRVDLFAVASVAMVLVSAAMAARNYSAPKQDMAGAVAYVTDQRGGDERVIAIGHAGPVFNGHFGTDWQVVMDPKDYQTAMAIPGALMVVIAFPGRSFRAIPQMDIDTETTLALVQKFSGTLGDGNILIFRRE